MSSAEVHEDVAGAQGGHGRAEDLVRDMTNALDRYIANCKSNVHQWRRKDREYTVEQESAFPALLTVDSLPPLALARLRPSLLSSNSLIIIT